MDDFESGTYQSDRFRFVLFTCNHLYYDVQRTRYICDISGRAFRTITKCKECSHLHVAVSAEPSVDLRVI